MLCTTDTLTLGRYANNKASPPKTRTVSNTDYFKLVCTPVPRSSVSLCIVASRCGLRRDSNWDTVRCPLPAQPLIFNFYHCAQYLEPSPGLGTITLAGPSISINIF